jgi:hypothetical protein
MMPVMSKKQVCQMAGLTVEWRSGVEAIWHSVDWCKRLLAGKSTD